MIGTLVTFIVSILISLILYVFTKKKWIVICICFIMMIISCYIVYNNKEHREFYLPLYDFSINFDMTRSDVINLLENDKKFIRTLYQDTVVGFGEFLEQPSFVLFRFSGEDKLCAIIYWLNFDMVINGQKLFSRDVDEFEEEVLKYLSDCYGTGEYFEEDDICYWKGKVGYDVSFICNEKRVIVSWYNPKEYNPKEFIGAYSFLGIEK